MIRRIKNNQSEDQIAWDNLGPESWSYEVHINRLAFLVPGDKHISTLSPEAPEEIAATDDSYLLDSIFYTVRSNGVPAGHPWV